MCTQKFKNSKNIFQNGKTFINVEFQSSDLRKFTVHEKEVFSESFRSSRIAFDA